MMESTQKTHALAEQIEWLEGENRAILFTKESAKRAGQKHAFHRLIDYKIQDGQIKKIKIYEGKPEIIDKAFA